MSERNSIQIGESYLVIKPRGMDKIWSFRRKLIVPLDHITDVRVENKPLSIPTGWRGPGLDIGVKICGTFHPNKEKHFWNYSKPGGVIVISVSGGYYFQKLCLSVANPESIKQLILEAI